MTFLEIIFLFKKSNFLLNFLGKLLFFFLTSVILRGASKNNTVFLIGIFVHVLQKKSKPIKGSRTNYSITGSSIHK